MLTVTCTKPAQKAAWRKAQVLLEKAKRAVEIAIEQDEIAAERNAQIGNWFNCVRNLYNSLGFLGK